MPSSDISVHVLGNCHCFLRIRSVIPSRHKKGMKYEGNMHRNGIIGKADATMKIDQRGISRQCSVSSVFYNPSKWCWRRKGTGNVVLRVF